MGMNSMRHQNTFRNLGLIESTAFLYALTSPSQSLEEWRLMDISSLSALLSEDIKLPSSQINSKEIGAESDIWPMA